jgi:hypothetical protein
MKQDRFQWNEKYRKHPHPAEVNGIVKRFYHLVLGKKALDIAAGTGCHAIFLTCQAFQSTPLTSPRPDWPSSPANIRTSLQSTPTWISSKSLPIDTTCS